MNEKLLKLSDETEEEIKEIIKEIDRDCMFNSQKVLKAFQKNNISEMHFNSTTGYGNNDVRKRCYRKSI